nr:immunoglobulin heavy chain junction region [Mus musculus]
CARSPTTVVDWYFDVW